MNVVGSSAWLGYFADSPNADHFAPAIEAIAGALILATARVHGATLWTQAVDFREVEGFRFLAKKV